MSPALARRSSLREKSPGAALAGWRRSGIRTGLRGISLLTGNFTGNFAILGLLEVFCRPKARVLQALLSEFPAKITGKLFFGNREIPGNIRVPAPAKCSFNRVRSKLVFRSSKLCKDLTFCGRHSAVENPLGDFHDRKIRQCRADQEDEEQRRRRHEPQPPADDGE